MLQSTIAHICCTQEQGTPVRTALPLCPHRHHGRFPKSTATRVRLARRPLWAQQVGGPFMGTILCFSRRFLSGPTCGVRC